MLRNVVKCCENRFHNISQHFITFHNILKNLMAFFHRRLRKRQLRPSNDRTYELSRKVRCMFFPEAPLNVVKSRTGQNRPILGLRRSLKPGGGISQHFRVFTTFHNIWYVFTTLSQARGSAAESRSRDLSIVPGLV